MREQVKDHRGLVRVDGSFIVNEDDDAYRAALARKKKRQQLEQTEKRLEMLEDKMDLILQILQGG